MAHQFVERYAKAKTRESSWKETKRILKAAFTAELPEEVINRKKAGFPVPYDRWLRKDLRAKVEEVLLSERALGRGYFRKTEVKKLLEANARKGKFAREVFSLLAVELWHREFVDDDARGMDVARAELPGLKKSK